MGAVSCILVVVAAADRAAVTFAGWANPSARFAGTSPFRGGVAGSAAKSYGFVFFEHDQRALRSPFGNLRSPLISWYRTQR